MAYAPNVGTLTSTVSLYTCALHLHACALVEHWVLVAAPLAVDARASRWIYPQIAIAVVVAILLHFGSAIVWLVVRSRLESKASSQADRIMLVQCAVWIVLLGCYAFVIDRRTEAVFMLGAVSILSNCACAYILFRKAR